MSETHSLKPGLRSRLLRLLWYTDLGFGESWFNMVRGICRAFPRSAKVVDILPESLHAWMVDLGGDPATAPVEPMIHFATSYYRELLLLKPKSKDRWQRRFSDWVHRYRFARVEAVELVTRKELWNEGQAQNNCVASYAYDCLGKGTSILSFRWMTDPIAGGEEYARLTVEVDHASRAVVQVRAKKNVMPSLHEQKAVRLWAQVHRLSVAQDSYVW
ncbi:MAG: PcfJ domain-containing protein [Armatimonadetes bacterium]|nr:PcfJ domain-containing protein [Armatimonadota bacterium]